MKFTQCKHILCFDYRFTVWPEDALEKVAEYYLKDMSINSDIASSCVVICKEFHTTARDASVRYIFSYLRFINFGTTYI